MSGIWWAVPCRGWVAGTGRPSVRPSGGVRRPAPSAAHHQFPHMSHLLFIIGSSALPQERLEVGTTHFTLSTRSLSGKPFGAPEEGGSAVAWGVSPRTRSRQQDPPMTAPLPAPSPGDARAWGGEHRAIF